MNAMVKERRAAGRPVLTQSRVKSVGLYNPNVGKWTALIARGSLTVGQEIGTLTPQGYRQIFIDYWPYRSARLAWLYMTGSFPPEGYCVDHINGNKSDDRWCNLRLATPQQNARNRGPCPRNTSGKVGVCKGIKPGIWNANITINEKTKSLGNFECKEDAIAARCKAEKHYFGEFAADAARYSDG